MTQSSGKKIQFVALISREDKPLYIQSFTLESVDSKSSENANKFLKYNFLSHMALDIFSSPSSISLREQQQEDNGGVLLLFVQDDIMVYGYETNNGLKIVIGLSNEIQEETEVESENQESITNPGSSHKVELKDLFFQIHKCYLRTICNPFTNLTGYSEDNETLLQSATFDKNINKIINGWNNI